MLKTKLKKIKWLKRTYDSFRVLSLYLAGKQQGLNYKELEEIIPDIGDQYTTFRLGTKYQRFKVRMQHAFQISLIKKVCGDHFNIIDIGDSSGNHIKYLRSLYSDISSLSINIDPEAIKKIRDKGYSATMTLAEDFIVDKRDPGLTLAIELLDHLENPISFLRKARENNYSPMVITLSFTRRGKIGLQYLRDDRFGKHPEQLHYYELPPEDWRLLFEHTGWEIKYDQIYYQYPRRIPIVSWLLKKYWQKLDYEGFYGAILEAKKIKNES